MVGAIIWYVTILGCAALFFGIGMYAKCLDKPMWFWSGSEVNPATITDIQAYNLENARLWKTYSIWFWAAGLAWIWNSTVALILLVLGCTVGIGFLVAGFLRIEKKYKA